MKKHTLFVQVLAFSCFWGSAGKVIQAQSVDSLQKELAYWRKRPAEWKAYKTAHLEAKARQAQTLDSIQNHRVFLVKLQELYDTIAERTEKADSLIPLYEAQKKALLREKKRKKHHLTFKIQIQMVQKHELDAFALPHTTLSIEQIGKSKRYLMGKFKHYEEAQAWVDVLVNGGASAYIVAYKNGERLSNFLEYLD